MKLPTLYHSALTCTEKVVAFRSTGDDLILQIPGMLISQKAFTEAIRILVNHTSFTDMTDEDIREIVEKELKRCWEQ